MRRRVLRVAIAISGAALLGGGAAPASIPPRQQVAIKATVRNETAPAASADWFAWSKSRGRGASPSDVWAQRGSGRAFKVNPRNTQAFTGGIDGARLVYQLLRRGGSRGSDLRMYDLQRRRHLALPAGVNTKLWECCPTISGDWLLFSRGRAYSAKPQLVVLRNLTTGEERILDRLANRDSLLSAGQVSGNYAVWARCNPHPRCQIIHYDLSAKATVPLSVPAGKVVYGPSVSPTGTTYYGRSNRGCGKSVELVKDTLDQPPEVLVKLAAGQDLDVTSASRREFGDLTLTRVYYDRVVCARKSWDIFAVTDFERPIPP